MLKFIFPGLLLFSQYAFPQNPHHYARIAGVLNIRDEIQMVYLHYFVAGETFLDSCLVKGNHFSFTTDIGEPVESEIYPKYGGRSASVKHMNDYVDFFIEPGIITINCSDSFSHANIVAGQLNRDYQYLKKLEKSYQDIDSLSGSINEKVYGRYFKNNPSAPLALFALNQYAGMDIDAEKIEPLFQKLAIKQKNTIAGKDFESRIQIAKRTGIGASAPGFSQKDTSGKLVSLSSFKGKYLLLVFWASWCWPCREENPALVKLYHDFADKDFQILSVSLEKPGAYAAWLNAIHKDGLNWTHVSDLKFWNNAAAREYGVLSLPQNYLIDKEGKIIAKNLEPAELAAKLKTIFD